MDIKIREAVRSRGGERCEYCRLREENSFYSFHVEHVIARQHGGTDALSNLAWACHQCNLRKGPNLSSIDPETSELTRLFHPREDEWKDHFALEGVRIKGLTPVGKTTAWLLQMNSQERLQLRKILAELGELD